MSRQTINSKIDAAEKQKGLVRQDPGAFGFKFSGGFSQTAIV
jgi:hypothetical protein